MKKQKKLKKKKLKQDIQGQLNFLICFNFFLSLSFMKEILPSYFSSEWSFASFKISETRSICCFSSDSSSVIG